MLKTAKKIQMLPVAIRDPFPHPEEGGRMVEVPTYHPSTEQFQDPITYINSIRTDAEPFGMCRIVPPEGWKVCIVSTSVMA